mmetsp:Transcript_16041/g.23524  ORF Transcript_16041/g.23524 Transcript_16041/m.23524 type:complete len:525 (-) Transcript_16041:339-1913(-)
MRISPALFVVVALVLATADAQTNDVQSSRSVAEQIVNLLVSSAPPYRDAFPNESWPKTYVLDDEEENEILVVREEKQIVDAVKHAREHNTIVRARGSLYSWPDVVSPTQGSSKGGKKERKGGKKESESGKKNKYRNVILDLESQYNKVLDVDVNAGLVTVQAGITVGALDEELARVNLLLNNRGNVLGMTVGGLVSTGSHGENPSLGVVSTSVRRVWIVDGNGRVVERDLSSPQHSRTNRALAVSLGLLGVISRLELRVVKNHLVTLEVTKQPFEEVVTNYEQLLRDNENLQMSYFPLSDALQVFATNELTTAPQNEACTPLSETSLLIVRGYAVFSSFFRLPFLQQMVESLIIDSSLVKCVSPAAPAISNGEGLLIDHYEMEGVIEFSKFEAFMRELRELYQREGPPIYPIDIRTTRSDEFFLSPAFSHKEDKVVWFDFLSPRFVQADVGRDQHVAEFSKVVPLLRKFNASFHLTKVTDVVGINNVRESLGAENLRNFSKVRKKFDPERVFAQDVLDEIIDVY